MTIKIKLVTGGLMGKAFSKEESEIIKNEIIRKAEEIFAIKGLKKTRVEDITEAVGIAKGSFYKFFLSKELLFMKILNKLDFECKQKFNGFEAENFTNNKLDFKAFFPGIFSMFSENLLLKKLFTGQEDFNYLITKVPPELISEHLKTDETFFLDFFRSWKDRGIISEKIDSLLLFSLIQSIILNFVNEDILGRVMFPKVVELQIDMLCTWLDKGGKDDDKS